MILKWKASINISDLLLFSRERKRKFGSYSNKTIWHVKSLCDEKGASAIGLVITVFFVFLLILLPINLLIQELNFYRILNHKVQIATEMACFDTMLRLNTNALSEEVLVMEGQLIEGFEADMKNRFMRHDAGNIHIEDLVVALFTGQHPNRLHVKFEYPYEAQFVLKGHLSKRVVVELNVELPMNN